MNFHKKKEIREKYLEPHIYVLSGKDSYARYEVCYHNKYITTKRKFKSIEDARQFKIVCNDFISKQRINNTNLKKNKHDEGLLEYPETILKDLGITPKKYLNYYTEIVPNFERNFEDASRFLKDREKDYIIKYYKYGKTLRECGEKENFTRERVRQIIVNGLEKIQHPSCFESLIKGTNKLSLISEKERNEIIEEFKEKVLKDLEEQKKQMTYEMALEIIKKHDEQPSVLCELCIEELKLNTRSYNCLKRAGINTIGQICNYTRKELKTLRGMGNGSLLNIKKRLKKMGLGLKIKEK